MIALEIRPQLSSQARALGLRMKLLGAGVIALPSCVRVNENLHLAYSKVWWLLLLPLPPPPTEHQAAIHHLASLPMYSQCQAWYLLQ